MSTFEILAAILGSSVLSTLLGAWFNIKILNRNYKKEYYKKILDRRIRAYEKTNDLAIHLSTYVQMEGFVVHAPFCAEDPLNFLSNQVRSCINENLWLNGETSGILTELNTFIINNFDNKLKPDWPKNKRNSTCRDIAYNNFDEINSIKGRLKNSVRNSIKNLYQIDEYFDEKDDSKTYPLYNRTYANPSDNEHYT